MTNNEFIHWISGYLMLSDDDVVNSHQLNIIENHANLVKAVTGELNGAIIQFLYHLEKNIKENNGFLALNEIRKISDVIFKSPV